MCGPQTTPMVHDDDNDKKLTIHDYIGATKEPHKVYFLPQSCLKFQTSCEPGALYIMLSRGPS